MPTATSDPSAPLAGITVVAVEHAIAAPFATRQLADLGARVIKIERPGEGDFARGYDATVRGLSSHFVWANRSKESVALDLKSAAATGILRRLLARADVFVQNLAPGAIDRLGFGADYLSVHCPQLIRVNLSGYGSSGPYRDRRAYDLLVQCEAGLASVTGTADTPCRAGIAVADIAAAMYAFAGTLAALFERERTGVARAVDVTMLDALGEWMGFPAYYATYGGKAPGRTGAAHPTVYPYGPFRCGDGASVFLSVQNDREWPRFCAEVLQTPDLAGDPRFLTNALRSSHRAELDRIIEGAFAAAAAGDVLARLDAAQIACGRLNGVADLWKHPQLEARGRMRTVASPIGELTALAPPIELEGVSPRMDPIPAVGEQTRAVLAEIGYADGEIAELAAAGVVGVVG
jgi:formyl-CoA transferase